MLLDKLRFRAEDGRYGLELTTEQLRRLSHWSQAAAPDETGGILIGRYNEARDTAIVEQVMDKTRDSRAGARWFYRGTGGLHQRLAQLWRMERWYYLGEWHSHPGAPPIPSPQDNAELSDIAFTLEEVCPEPVLFIIGRSLQSGYDCGAYVYPKGRRISLLHHEPEGVE